MKSSNPRVMIQSVRLLAAQMESEGMSFPIHLGVTEAGDGMEGRIKSAVGMAPLLMDGLGDTIRVSLTEAPENELPVARLVTELFPRKKGFSAKLLEGLAWDPYSFRRRKASRHEGMGGAGRVKVVSTQPPVAGEDLHPLQLRERDGLRLFSSHEGSLPEIRQAISAFCKADTHSPIVFRHVSQEADPLRYRLQLAGELGYFLVDGYVDAVWAENPHFDEAFINEALLHILQAAGARMSKTEYIACPSCGRTHFDILERLKEIREATAHLKPLKIGVMGCIVNGPGEMADADYGYVGAGRGRVSLYKGKVPVEENLPEEQALDALIALIKKGGDWVED
jgi:(E)-4-hydroxy-3-methylbut-2-enyl-diphosphate synthase